MHFLIDVEENVKFKFHKINDSLLFAPFYTAEILFNNMKI